MLNVITGHGEVGDELTSNPMVDMIAFTGSTATGRRIMANGAATVKRYQLELGGKSAQVLLDDVSEDYARSIGFGSTLTHCGQGCILATRLLLPEHLLDAYKDGVAAAAPNVKIGNPTDPSTDLGPLIREQQRARVEGYVASGSGAGCRAADGRQATRRLREGLLSTSPRCSSARNDMRIAQEEIFGPVFTVVPYSGTDDDAVRLANDSIYGLGGGVESTSTARAFNVARRIRAGTVLAQGVGDVTGHRRRTRRRARAGLGRDDGRHRPERRLRWLQAERHRPRVGPSRARGVHRDQGHSLELIRAPSRTPVRERRNLRQLGSAATGGLERSGIP